MFALHSIFLTFNKYILSDTYYMRNVLHKSTTNIYEVYLSIEGYNNIINNQKMRFLKNNLEKNLTWLRKTSVTFGFNCAKYS